MARREELLDKCKDLGVEPEKSRNRINKDTGERYQESTVLDCEKAIQKYYLDLYEREGHLNPFIKSILKLDSPMLALQIKDKKLDKIRDLIWENNNKYMFQEKIDGCRCMFCYDKNFGNDYYSRNKSVTDCLPISYKTKLLMPEINQNVLNNFGINNFIIDSELIPLHKSIENMLDGTETVADTQLNLVTSILGSLDDLSHKLQETNPLKFMAFDLIKLNDEWLIDLPLVERYKKLIKILSIIKSAGLNDRIEPIRTTMINKEQFYNHILAEGGEGCVVKDLTSKYDILGKRAGEWIKVKRTVSQSILEEKTGDTIDVFVTGFKEGTHGTSNEGLVGALEFSTYLTDDNDNLITDETGNPIIHHIATISGITNELRFAISEIDEFGQVKLKNEIYGKVATIDGQDISSRNKRFSHATFQGWRPDRSAESCKFRESYLNSLIL